MTWMRRTVIVAADSAFCVRCKAAKPVAQFAKQPRCVNGLSSYCNSCKNDGTRRWRAEHRDEINAARRADTRAKERDREYRRRRAAARPPRALQRCDNCLRAFVPRGKQRFCEDLCQNRFRHRTQPRPQKKLRQAVLERDGYRCYLCGMDIDRALVWPHPNAPSIDHVKPVSAGGTNDVDNLRAAHWHCNEDKGDRLLSEVWAA